MTSYILHADHEKLSDVHFILILLALTSPFVYSADDLDFKDWQRFCIKMYPSLALWLEIKIKMKWLPKAAEILAREVPEAGRKASGRVKTQNH